MSAGPDQYAAPQLDTEPRLRHVAWLLAALAAGPATWVLQLVAGYALSSYACFPHDVPWHQAPPPGWSGEPAILLVVNLACLALDLTAALYCARRLAGAGGNGAAPRDVRRTRTRFLALCGVMASVGFAGAIALNTANIFMVPTCWSIVP
jgi:hypothetical protein